MNNIDPMNNVYPPKAIFDLSRYDLIVSAFLEHYYTGDLTMEQALRGMVIHLHDEKEQLRTALIRTASNSPTFIKLETSDMNSASSNE